MNDYYDEWMKQGPGHDLYGFTLKLILCTLIVWGFYDILAELACGNECTESAWVFRLGWSLPSVPLLWGILTAHFFAETRAPSPREVPVPVWVTVGKFLVLGLAALWAVWDLVAPGGWPTRLVDQLPMNGTIVMLFIGQGLGFVFCQMHGATMRGGS